MNQETEDLKQLEFGLSKLERHEKYIFILRKPLNFWVLLNLPKVSKMAAKGRIK
jgi:hypothetical protein